MYYVATLISHPDTYAVTHDLCREITRYLPEGRIAIRLHPGFAVDITFEFPDLDDPHVSPDGERAFLNLLTEDCCGIVGSAPVDIVIQPDDEHRRKRLLIADMDSTMIGQECIDELADFAGVKPEVAAITERAMLGEIAFEPALRARVALLKGLPARIVDEVIASRITLTPGARTLVATMRAHGAKAALVSGGFTLFTAKIAAQLGFHNSQANDLIVRDGHLTGEVAEPILGRAAKQAALARLCKKHRIKLAATLAVGDGANDLDMLGAAGLGIAYHAKPAVAAAAHAAIRHGDLTALLYAQGYRREEFVEG